MDLSTIKKRLDTGVYKDPWQYVEDVWLMFENAWLYNRKTSRVHKFSTKVGSFGGGGKGGGGEGGFCGVFGGNRGRGVEGCCGDFWEENGVVGWGSVLLIVKH